MTPHRQQTALTRLLRNRLAVSGGAILVAMLALALLAPYLAPSDPATMNPQHLLEGPSAAHWLGTDEFGRDMLSRIMWGARITLAVSVFSVALALLAGSALGVLSGYFGGLLDGSVSRLLEVIFAFPTILLALGIVGLLGPSVRNLVVAIGVVYTPVFARLARGSVLAVKGREYVEAARTLGAAHPRILVRHILPNITAPLIVQASLSLSLAVLIEASLSFLGLGPPPPTPSWGSMVNSGQKMMELSPGLAIFPGLAIMLVVLALNVLGDGLRDALDPRLRS